MTQAGLTWLRTSLQGLTLGRKIVLLALVGLVLGGVVFALLGMQALQRSTEVMLQERLTLTRLVGDYSDEVLGRSLRELRLTAMTIDFDRPVATKSNLDALDSLYSKMAIGTLDLFVLDKTARVLWSMKEGDAAAGRDMSYYPCFADVVGSRPCVSGLLVAPALDTPAILLSSGLQVGVNATEGVLVAAIDLAQSSIGGFIQPISLGKTGYVEIVDQNGVVIARTSPGQALTPFEKSDHPERFAELIEMGRATVGTCHTCHEEARQPTKRDVLAFVPLQEVPWGVVIRQAEEEALASTQDLKTKLLLAGIGLIGGVVLFVGFSTQTIVRRIRSLTSACLRIANGNLDMPVTPLGTDEIGVLAETFDNMRLNLKRSHEELQRHEQARRDLLRLVMSTQEEERRRIARELHDETSQALASFTVNLETAIKALPPDAEASRARLRELQSQVVNTLEEIHNVVYELRPTVLDDLGLIAAVQWQIENHLAISGVETHFETVGQERRLPQEIETAVFRLIQEASNNIIMHANAETASITLDFRSDRLLVLIEDDGKGFNVQEIMSMRERGSGLGLLGMKERVEFLGGTIDIKSGPGTGTQLSISIPIPNE